MLVRRKGTDSSCYTMPTSDYFTSLNYEAQKRYSAKLTIDKEDLPDPYGIPDDMWQDDITKWPSLELGISTCIS